MLRPEAYYRGIAAAIAPHVKRTPLLRAEALDEMAGCEVWLKAELFQHTGSYKPRGMVHELGLMGPESRARGLITFSAGNAALGLAYAAGRTGARAIAVMPDGASAFKVAAARALGAEVILHGTARDAFALMQQMIADKGYRYVPPSDHPDMIEGNASLGLEIADDAPDADAVFVPIGGGGMVSGVALGLRAAGSRAIIVGIEPTGAATMHGSLAAGKPTDLPGPPVTIADGLAYPFGGRYTYPIVRDLVQRVELVEDEEIRLAMLALMTRAKLFAEPSAAASLAGLVRHRAAIAEAYGEVRKVVLVVSGGNLDPDRLKTFL